MPTYCFIHKDDGRNLELFIDSGAILTLRQIDGTYDLGLHGKGWRRNYAAELGAYHPGNWPMVSDALGVHPNQVQEAVADARRAGIGVEFNSQGQAILASPGMRKAYAQHRGQFDRNAGYGDPAPLRAHSYKEA